MNWTNDIKAISTLLLVVLEFVVYLFAYALTRASTLVLLGCMLCHDLLNLLTLVFLTMILFAFPLPIILKVAMYNNVNNIHTC